MENGEGTNGKRIRAEDVICKIKDDGDFDKLRIKIVRRMKENVSICLFFFDFVDQGSSLGLNCRVFVIFGFCIDIYVFLPQFGRNPELGFVLFAQLKLYLIGIGDSALVIGFKLYTLGVRLVQFSCQYYYCQSRRLIGSLSVVFLVVYCVSYSWILLLLVVLLVSVIVVLAVDKALFFFRNGLFATALICLI